MNLTVALPDAALEQIAQRVAEILAAREPESTAPDLLTIDQAAELAAVSRKTVSNWLSAGRLVRYGVPRAPRISRSELLGLLAPEPPSDGRAVRRPRLTMARPASPPFSNMARRG